VDGPAQLRRNARAGDRAIGTDGRQGRRGARVPSRPVPTVGYPVPAGPTHAAGAKRAATWVWMRRPAVLGKPKPRLTGPSGFQIAASALFAPGCCSAVIALASAAPIHTGSSRWSPLASSREQHRPVRAGLHADGHDPHLVHGPHLLRRPASPGCRASTAGQGDTTLILRCRPRCDGTRTGPARLQAALRAGRTLRPKADTWGRSRRLAS